MIFLILFFSIPALVPLLMPGFFEPHDLHHFADIYQMAQAILSGQFPPRLGPDFIYGFSYPLFNFYYVLPFYIGAFILFLTGSIIAGYKFVFILSGLLGSVGMYLFVRKYASKTASFLSSLLFLYTPYRAVQFYVRGAMGEALALSIAPFVALAIVNLVRKPNYRNIIYLSVGLVFFILSHNYLFLLFAPFLIILFFIEFFQKSGTNNIKILKFTFISGISSIFVTAYWWLPAFFEYRLVSSQTPFNYIDHFPFIKQLIIPSWGYGSSHWGPYDEISFQIGLINILFVLLFVLLLFVKFFIKKQRIKAIYIWSIFSFVFCVFMMNIRSNIIWEIMPFTNFIQFPWRFLMFTTFFSSFIAGVFIEEIELRKSFKKVFVFITLLIIIIFNFKYFRPSKIVFHNNSFYLNRFFALNGYISDEYKNYSEDYLLLPKGILSKPDYLPAHKFLIENLDKNTLEEEQISKIHWISKVNLKESSQITVNVLFFPGWNVYVDGVKKEIFTNKDGFIVFDLDQGEYELELKWEETDLRKFADFISIFGIILLVYFYFKK